MEPAAGKSAGEATGRLREAVVLSGGGAKGAFEVGVLKALAAGASPATGYQPIGVDIYTGTSVGAYNATFLASRGGMPLTVAVARLEEVWRQRIANTPEHCGNGVYRVRGLPFQGLSPGCFLNPVQSLIELGMDGAFFGNFLLRRGVDFLTSQAPLGARVPELVDLSAFFSPQPLEALVAQTLDLGLLPASPCSLTIAASNWRNGKLRLFGKEDVARLGRDTVLASASIPGLFPPVTIEGTPFVDGSVLMDTPLRPALQAGAQVVHVIYLDPFVEEIPFPDLPNTPDTIYRLYSILVASQIGKDLAMADRINLSLAVAGGGAEGRLGDLLTVAGRLAQRPAGRAYRQVTIHRYRPHQDLGGAGGLLDFRSETIDRLVGLGYANAAQHDCRQEGCSLFGPGNERTLRAPPLPMEGRPWKSP
jgi:NTE family protein